MNKELINYYSLIAFSSKENISASEKKECIKEVFSFLKNKIESKNTHTELLLY